jgi:hypothetical protein
MTELWRDIRYGLRLLCKSAGFASVSLLALALGDWGHDGDFQRALFDAPCAAPVCG